MSGRVQAGGLAVLAVAATAFEGGASPHGILLVHGLLVLLGMLALAFPPADAPRLPRGTGAALLVFGTLVLVSASRAPYAFAAWLVVQDVALGMGALLLASRVGGNWPTWALPALLAAGALQGAIALVQTVRGDARAAGTLLNPNHLAGWAVAVLLAAAVPVVARGGPRRVLAAILAAGTAVGFVLPRSRGAALGMLAGMAALAVLRWRWLPTTGRRVLLGGAVLALLLGGTLFALRLREQDPYRWTRTRIWTAATEIARSSPWLGCGPGQFGIAAAQVRFPDPVGPLRWDRTFSLPHSDLLRVPAELGFPAALALLLGLGCALVGAVRKAREERAPARACALAGLSALAVQALVDDLSARPALVLLAAILLGSAAALPADRPAGPGVPRTARLALAALLALLFAAGDVAPWLAWRTLAGHPRREDTQERLARARAWNPVHPDTHLRLAERALRARPLRPEDYAQARAEAETAVRLSPRDARYRVGLAQVEAAACRVLFRDEAARARASEAYASAEALAPRQPAILLEHGLFLLYAQDPGGARRTAERAVALEPGAVAPRLLLARIHLALGDVAAARRLLGEAEAMAAQYRDLPRESPYAATMLDFDREEAAAMHRALQALR